MDVAIDYYRKQLTRNVTLVSCKYYYYYY